ncbi:hypothetical protein TNCV_3527111 [Trichonephila clavipes]|nr:hypothetical protein TNCV_3527111 [Trichonephila clavipes]
MLQYPPEYLSSLAPSVMPPTRGNLELGCFTMLLKNLCITDGLSDATRLIVKNVQKNILECEISSGDKEGNIVYISRITLDTGGDWSERTGLSDAIRLIVKNVQKNILECKIFSEDKEGDIVYISRITLDTGGDWSEWTGLSDATRLIVKNVPKNILGCEIFSGDKEGDIVYISRITLETGGNWSEWTGLSDATRLIVKNVPKNILECEIFSGDKEGDIVYIPRITLDTGGDLHIQFVLKQKVPPSDCGGYDPRFVTEWVRVRIPTRAQEDLYNRVFRKSWKNAILNLRNGPKRRAVAEFHLTIGHNCLQNHLYRLLSCSFPDIHSVQHWRGHGLRISSSPKVAHPWQPFNYGVLSQSTNMTQRAAQ